MKTIQQTGITLDRISTREELVEVMDMLCQTRLTTRSDSEFVPPPQPAPNADQLLLDPMSEDSDAQASTELRSLTNLLLGEFEWIN